MGFALLNTATETELAGTSRDSAPAAVLAEPADALRMQVAERLAAHRRRRSGAQASSATICAAEPARSGSTRSARIAAAVAERYAHTPSYRALLAAEAERAIEQARAAAEVAAINAQAIAAAQQRLLDAFDEDEDEMRRAAHNQARTAAAQSAAAQSAKPDEFLSTHAGTSPHGNAVELNLWPDLTREQDREESRQESRREHAEAAQSSRHGVAPDPRGSVGGKELAQAAASPALRSGRLTVRLYEDAAGLAQEYSGVTHRAPAPAHTNRREYRNDTEAQALDEEIAFRQAPVFEEPAGPPVPLPANLIEFPRQLVASRKARPRYAEGPLRDQGEAAPLDGQLRIFEVDAAQISTQPAEADTVMPQWTSIWLDAPSEPVETGDYAGFEHGLNPEGRPLAEPGHPTVPAVQVAANGRRVLAGAVDAGIVVAGVLAFAAIVAKVFILAGLWQAGADQPGASRLQILRQLAALIVDQTGLQPSQIAMIAAVACVFLAVLYQALFFWFSESTPGMRCARIALCTFDDENPTRRAVRRRLGAMLLSAFPLGLGFAWAMLDEQRLTWHDRLTRMYLRSY
jgi:uncharacterized RDD family membrane protein YckC